MVKENAAEFQQYLEANEELIWTGKPKQGIVFRKVDYGLIPFSIIYTCGTIGVGIFAAMMTEIYALGLVATPFVLLGFLLSFGRMIFDAKYRAKSVYAITNKRLMIKTDILNQGLSSLYADKIKNVKLKEHKDGSGTISVIEGHKSPGTEQNFAFGSWMNVMPYNSSPFFQLEFIDDAQKVSELLMKVKNQHVTSI
ncbi:PH domain-containing protein [Flammeovirga aprica]|uniref:PH domain-containing protein n=1 Tax=Flammeovirga aprica JL-4 TaxID=694437 RepID=A0A7X9RXX9_9BACT|nr:PH domain-containing protein [Flammeovirga aprica]NME70715.1 PH domain-containing protein [Flammeovirga aprica JL-4]